ncbi:MAG: hypothetical protein V4559_01045 [Pseudomonadota bacterium]
MKISKIAFSAVFLSAAVFPVELRAQEKSAFEVFKTFCIDTDLDKTAINAKAVSLGASPVNTSESGLADVLANTAGIQESKAAWVSKLGDRQFVVYFTSADLPPPAQDARHRDICHVVFRGDDARVIDDFDHWIGLSDSEAIRQPVLREKSFEFEMVDGKHVPLPKTWRVDPAYSKRVTWTAEVSQWRALSLSLERTKPF